SLTSIQTLVKNPTSNLALDVSPNRGVGRLWRTLDTCHGNNGRISQSKMARRMISSAADTTKELTDCIKNIPERLATSHCPHSIRGGKIFTNSYLDKHMAAPGEPGLSPKGVDSKDMDRFVNSLIFKRNKDEVVWSTGCFHSEILSSCIVYNPRSKSMPEEYKSEQFKLQDIIRRSLEMVKIKASKALFKKMAGTPAESLNNYYTKMMDGKDIDHSEGMKFLEWKLTQKWRIIYVHEWQNGMLETGSRRKLLEGYVISNTGTHFMARNKITKTELTGSPENEANLQTQNKQLCWTEQLVTDLFPMPRLKKPWWHLRNILDKLEASGRQ
ncbi:hypothetical protein PSHT_15700, partial [Puccinia striiformis]